MQCNAMRCNAHLFHISNEIEKTLERIQQANAELDFQSLTVPEMTNILANFSIPFENINSATIPSPDMSALDRNTLENMLIDVKDISTPCADKLYSLIENITCVNTDQKKVFDYICQHSHSPENLRVLIMGPGGDIGKILAT